MSQLTDPDRVADLRRRLEQVREAIERAAVGAGRSREAAAAIRILATVKYVDAAACIDLMQAGHRDLAENRADALDHKHDRVAELSLPVAWHFIGRLQSRQAPAIAKQVDMIHTLCSTSAANRLASVDPALLPRLLVQVNMARDPAKDGIDPTDLEAFLSDLPEALRISGLMTMPAFTQEPEQSRPAFAALRELRDTLALRFVGRHDLTELSMGTTQDYLVAVQEGATQVRLGRILLDGVE